jgi:hypothetical protein
MYIFNGRVHPERAHVTLSQPLSCDVRFKGRQDVYNLIITVDVGQVNIIVDTKKHDDLYTLKNLVRDCVANVIDAYGYLKGRTHHVEITSVVDTETLESIVFSIEIPVIADSSAERHIKDFDIVLGLAMDSPQLRRALASLRHAMASVGETAFFCYHAVESIKCHFYLPEEDPNDEKCSKKAWERLRNALRIEKEFIVEGIKKLFADEQRHGLDPHITDFERAQLFSRTWQIVDRFCVFLQMGVDTLPKESFKLLAL